LKSNDIESVSGAALSSAAAGGNCRLWPAGLSNSGRNAFSPRVPVAIRNDAASRIATVSVLSSLTDRDADHRALSRKNFGQEFRAGILKDPEK
jgi:hypothetical protein